MATEARICDPGGRGFLFPATESEQTWEVMFRAVLYLLALLYTFLGVSIVADKFVEAIETITSSKRRVLQSATGRIITVSVWNGTVANLTLMALGSSSPEILLSVIEIIGNDFFSGSLGPGTIVGSAAFNLFGIVGVCIMAVPAGETRQIKELGVYKMTAFFSIFAYIWLVVIVKMNSVNVIELWEALATLGLLPVLILVSYLTDIGWWSGKPKAPIIQRPLAACPESQRTGPIHSEGDFRASSVGAGRTVWRPRGPVSEEGSSTPTDTPCDVLWQEFFDPGVITDKNGLPYHLDAGIFTFSEDSWDVSSGLEKRELLVPVFRKNGTEGMVACRYRTEGRSAVAGYDFVHAQGELKFPPGQTEAVVALELLPKRLGEASDQFQLILEDPQGGAVFNPNHDGAPERSILSLTIHNENDDMTQNSASLQLSQFLDKAINMDQWRLGTRTWYEDVISAITDVTEEGERVTCLHWFMHLISIPWKFAFAVIVPPPAYFGGWLCFWMSLAAIGGVTCIVMDFAELFGCVAGIEDSITAFTIVALGTSMPDLFASKKAACDDVYADASIVNVTGSNSVNVFLGIGLPWAIAAIYWQIAGPSEDWKKQYEGKYPSSAFVVEGDDLVFSVAVFTLAALVALVILHLRRSRLGGELGGPVGLKYLSGMFFILLWVFYIVLSIWFVVAKPRDVGQQLFTIFIAFCTFENIVLCICVGLLVFRGPGFFTAGKQKSGEEDEEACLGARDMHIPGDLRQASGGQHFDLAPMPPKLVHARFPGNVVYGRSASRGFDFTRAAFVCWATRRFKRNLLAYRDVMDLRPPVPPPLLYPPTHTAPGPGLERCPSFHSLDSYQHEGSALHPAGAGSVGECDSGQQARPAWRAARSAAGVLADMSFLAIAGLAANTLANPNGTLGP